MQDLTKKHCVPCENGEGKLTMEKIKEYLPAAEGWFLIGDQIKKDFKFKDFKEAMSFVNKVADLAESEGHHPDIYIFYNKVNFSLHTHAAKGLTENDFIIAAKINNLEV
jgi:4a-hydroxytetrahydrobiopterin dehydratase